MTWCQGMQLLVPLSGWCIMYQSICVLPNFQQHHAVAGLRKCPEPLCQGRLVLSRDSHQDIYSSRAARIAAFNLEQLQTAGMPRGTSEPCPEAWHVCTVLPAVVVRQRKPWRRKDGVFIYFEDNAGVIVNPKGEMKGMQLFASLCWFHTCMCMPQLRQ